MNDMGSMLPILAGTASHEKPRNQIEKTQYMFLQLKIGGLLY